MDADNEVPSFALDKLLSLDVDVASGVYPVHDDFRRMIGGPIGDPPNFHVRFKLSRHDMKGKVFGELGYVGGGNGCLLVKRRVFEYVDRWGKPLRFRYMMGIKSSDLQFFVDTQVLEFSVRVHGDVVCGHLPEYPLKQLIINDDDAQNISIVMPFYDKYTAFKETWLMLEPQLQFGDELIVIDDNTPLEGFMGETPFGSHWIKLLRPEKTISHIYRLNKLRNMGIGEAKNDAILILDPDCIPDPDLLANARKLYNHSTVYSGRIDRQTPTKVEEDQRLAWKIGLKDSRYIDDCGERGFQAMYGGCLLFSKIRTSMVAWFSREYDGAWGCDDNDFAVKCYHSGMRLRYEQSLKVTHQYHPKNLSGYDVNLKLYAKKRKEYKLQLNVVSPYKPETMVLAHPTDASPCLTSVFQAITPIKATLMYEGDVRAWKDRWCIECVGVFDASKTKEEATNRGFRFLVTITGDRILGDGELDELIIRAKNSPSSPEIRIDEDLKIERLNPPT